MGSRLGRATNPGRFFDRADIEEQARVPDGRGGYTLGDWAPITGGSDIPVSLEALEGMERISAMQTQADVTHEVETSVYVEGVKPSHRLKITSDGDRILNIVSAPVVIGRKRRLMLMCSEDTD